MGNLPHPSCVDIIVIVALVVGAMNGLRRKLSGEIAATAGSVIALLFALQFYAPAGRAVAEHTRLSVRGAQALTFSLTIVAGVLLMLAARILLKHTISIVINNTKVERVGGLLAGLVKTLVAVIVVFLALLISPNNYLDRVFREESIFGTLLSRALPAMQDQAEKFVDGMDELVD